MRCTRPHCSVSCCVEVRPYPNVPSLPLSIFPAARRACLPVCDAHDPTLTLTSLLGSEPVERVVTLGHSADEAREGEDGAGALDDSAVLVDVWDRDLNRGVVLGLDDAASGGTLAWHVKIDEVTLDMRETACVSVRFGDSSWEAYSAIAL